MPQDHAYWDRKDLLRQRKHERPEQPFDSSFRWRSSSSGSSSHHVPREFCRLGSGDLRRPPGHGKQGGRHQFVEDTDHGHASSRSSGRIFEVDNHRPSASRGDWRYNRNPRDDRVYFGKKDWKYHTWEVNHGSPRACGRVVMKNDSSPVDERSSSASDPRTAMVKLSVPANLTQQNIEVCAPVKTLAGNSDQNFANQRQSPHSYCHSDSARFYGEHYLGRKLDNKCFSPGRQCHDVSCDQRFADNGSLHPLNSYADLEVTQEQLRSKDQQDNGVQGVNGMHIAKQFGKESSSLGSIDLKHPLWSRSGSFVSRGSGFIHSSSPKSLGAVDSSEQKTELLPKIVAATKPTSGDAAACFISSCLPEEMNSRKKPRLGWGEGLAKYEKKKVDVKASEDGTTLLANSIGEAYSLVDKSPIRVGASDFGSPSTPSSVACSFSPGMGDKAPGMEVKAIISASNQCRSPSPTSNYQLERFPLNLENIESISMENLSYLLNELLRTDDSGPGDSCTVQLNAMKKLLAWKGDILKALEVTESEIDLLENKCGALKFVAGSSCPHQIGPNSYLCVSNDTVASELGAPCVAERLERDVHTAVSAKVPVDTSGEGVERSQDTVDIPSFKRASCPTNVDMPSFAMGSSAIDGDAVDLSSGCCGIASLEEVVSKIFASNRKSACESSEVINLLLPRQFSYLEDSRFSGICQKKVDCRIKQKIALRRRFKREREKILVLQFKASLLSWKRDMHQLAIAKYGKSQKKCESNLNIKNGALQKLPLSVRLKFSSPAPGRESPFPTMDIQCKPCRGTQRMPTMVLGEIEEVKSRFISRNGLVEDPCAVEKERTRINPWTSEEREIFLNKLSEYGKDFRKIASHFEHKTTADCISFYYKNHKSDCFEKIKKKLGNGEEGKCTFMLAPPKKWKREMGAASLDILGAVSMIAANASKVASTRQMSSKRMALGGCSSSRSFQHGENSSEGCFYNFDLPGKQTVSAVGLTGGDDSLPSEPISSCIRSCIDPEERSMKHPKFDPTLKMSGTYNNATQNDNSNDEDDTCSEDSCEQTGRAHWTDEERSAFMQGFSLYGKNFAMISRCVGTRSQDQCKVFFSKVRKCLGLELIQLRSGNASTSTSVDHGNEGGGSEAENLSGLEAGSVMCNGDLCSKMDADSPNSPLNINHDGADHSGSVKLDPDLSGSQQQNGLVCLHLKDGVELVDANVSLNGDRADLVSEVSRGFLDDKTVENNSQAVQKRRSDQLLPTATDEGVSASTVVYPWPSSPDATILANLIMKSFAERSRKYPPGQAEAASSSGFGFPESLHHVPIEVCMEEPMGFHLPQENPSNHSETVSPTNYHVQGAERCSSDVKPSDVHHGCGEKIGFYGRDECEQNSLQDVHVSNMDAFLVPWSSFMPDPSGRKRSKSSDVVIATTHRRGEGFSLSRCSSLTSNGSTAKQPKLSRKESKSGHGGRHSRSLSDTERPYKSGDVKLFGRVLTSRGGEKLQHRHVSIGPSASIDQRDLQNVPISSYGFWDGNRIRTGFTSLQYPEAFATHVVESSASEVRVGTSREIQPDGLSVYTRRKLNGCSEIPGFEAETQIDRDRDKIRVLEFRR